MKMLQAGWRTRGVRMCVAIRGGVHRQPSHNRGTAAAAPTAAAAAAAAPSTRNDPFAVITPERGFLPSCDPCTSISHHPELQPWEQAAADIPKLCLISGSGRLRKWLLDLPPFPLHLLPLLSGPELWRAHMVLSFIAHAFMWCEQGDEVPQVLPERLAVPWAAVSKSLGMPPVLVYATYNLLNWRRLDPSGPIQLGNIVCLNNFLGGMDEEHFRVVHVDIEARAAPAVAQLLTLQQAAAQCDEEAVLQGLACISKALSGMQATLSRMGEKCDPHVYYQRVRLPMSGWRGNPALPKGLIYEGVSPEPVQLYGETGAQSSILHAFDAALGIEHQQDWLKAYLQDMTQHMPPAHRAFIQQIRDSPLGPEGGVRGLCAAASPGKGLKEAYNETVNEMEKFRSQHKAFAYNYIAKFSAKEVGTGGSDFMALQRRGCLARALVECKDLAFSLVAARLVRAAARNSSRLAH